MGESPCAQAAKADPARGRWTGRLVVRLMRLIAPLPLPVLRGAGWLLGSLCWPLARGRRHVALVNLRLCFPQWSEKRRRQVARQSFICFFQAFLDRACVWHGAPRLLLERVRITGQADELRRPEAAVLFAPHFYGMDAGGSAIIKRLIQRGCTIYTIQRDAALDAWMRQGRQRFGDVQPLNREDGVKLVIKALRGGEATIVLPDHVPSPEEGGDGVWVDFFGKPAYTMTLAGKLAQVKGVKALFFCGERLPDGKGFVLHIEPLRGELNGDKENDARVINENTEYWIRRFPEQYLFMYNRYKHPEGAPFPPEI